MIDSGGIIMRWLMMVWCVVSAAGVAVADDQRLFEQWQVMTIDRLRVGHSRTEIRQTSEGTIRSSQQTSLKFKRFGEDVDMQTLLTTEERSDGTLISFRYEQRNLPAKSTISSGKVAGSLWELESKVAGRTSTQRITRPAELKSPLYQDRMFLGRTMRPGLTDQFSVWQPELSKAGGIKFQVDDRRETALYDGTKAKLFKVYVTNPLIPSLNLRGYVDERGRWLKSEGDFAGKILTTYAVSAEEAIQELAGGELDLALAALVRVEGLRNPHASQKVVYRITTQGANPADFFPSDAWQEVEPVDDETIRLTVRKAIAPTPATPATRQTGEFLLATNFLQSNDRRVIELARGASAGIGNDPLRIALNMESTVREKIRKQTFSTALASAAEVAQSLEGDCTEHAMLLAAMLRVQRIPSRVAVGFVYVPRMGAFTGHMWTEAWIRDRWLPLDATLERGSSGAGHIKLSDSSLGENSPAPITVFLPMMQLTGKMKIEVVQQQ